MKIKLRYVFTALALGALNLHTGCSSHCSDSANEYDTACTPIGLEIEQICLNGRIDPTQRIDLQLQNTTTGKAPSIQGEVPVNVSLVWQDGRPATQIDPTAVRLERDFGVIHVDLQKSIQAQPSQKEALKQGGAVVFQVIVGQWDPIVTNVPSCSLDPLP